MSSLPVFGLGLFVLYWACGRFSHMPLETAENSDKKAQSHPIQFDNRDGRFTWYVRNPAFQDIPDLCDHESFSLPSLIDIILRLQNFFF